MNTERRGTYAPREGLESALRNTLTYRSGTTRSLLTTGQKRNPFEALNEGLDPWEILSDLRLPKDLVNELDSAFQALDINLDETEVRDESLMTDESRPAHCFRADDHSVLYLVYIPNTILEHPVGKNIAAVDYIRSFFSEDTRVYIVSRGIDKPKLAFRLKLKTWSHFRVQVEFIAWTDLEDIMEYAAQGILEARKAALRENIFKLGQPSADEILRVTLNENERRNLIELMSRAARSWNDYKDFFKDLLRGGSLPTRLQDMRISNLGVNPEHDARALISWALDVRMNPDRPTYSVLAELLDVLFNYVGLEDQRFLFNLVVAKPLISGDDLADFRERRDGNPGG